MAVVGTPGPMASRSKFHREHHTRLPSSLSASWHNPNPSNPHVFTGKQPVVMAVWNASSSPITNYPPAASAGRKTIGHRRKCSIRSPTEITTPLARTPSSPPPPFHTSFPNPCTTYTRGGISYTRAEATWHLAHLSQVQT